MEKRFLTFQHTPWEGPGIHLLQEEHPFLKAEKAAICQSIEEKKTDPTLDFVSVINCLLIPWELRTRLLALLAYQTVELKLNR